MPTVSGSWNGPIPSASNRVSRSGGVADGPTSQVRLLRPLSSSSARTWATVGSTVEGSSRSRWTTVKEGSDAFAPSQITNRSSTIRSAPGDTGIWVLRSSASARTSGATGACGATSR